MILFTGGSLSRGVSVQERSLCQGDPPSLYSNVRVVRILFECILVTISCYNFAVCVLPHLCAMDSSDSLLVCHWLTSLQFFFFLFFGFFHMSAIQACGMTPKMTRVSLMTPRPNHFYDRWLVFRSNTLQRLLPSLFDFNSYLCAFIYWRHQHCPNR